MVERVEERKDGRTDKDGRRPIPKLETSSTDAMNRDGEENEI